MSNNADIDLFIEPEALPAVPGGFDFFGDEDNQDEPGHPHGEQSTDFDEEALARSIENFYGIFTNREDRVNASSGAILLYQHLLGAGYKADIAVEDNGALVTASTDRAQLIGPLLERVEYLLDDMVYVSRRWKATGFTVHRITTKLSGVRMTVGIEFISV